MSAGGRTGQRYQERAGGTRNAEESGRRSSGGGCIAVNRSARWADQCSDQQA